MVGCCVSIRGGHGLRSLKRHPPLILTYLTRDGVSRRELAVEGLKSVMVLEDTTIIKPDGSLLEVRFRFYLTQFIEFQKVNCPAKPSTFVFNE